MRKSFGVIINDVVIFVEVEYSDIQEELDFRTGTGTAHHVEIHNVFWKGQNVTELMRKINVFEQIEESIFD